MSSPTPTQARTTAPIDVSTVPAPTADELKTAYTVAVRSRAAEEHIVRLASRGEIKFAIWGPGEEIHGTATALALSKLVAFGAAQQLELRLETFNLFNTFNWGNPQDQLTSRFFGRISSQAGDPRIFQFGIKYAF